MYKIKNIFIIFKTELKMRYKSIIFWVIGLIAVMSLYMFIYPDIKDMMIEEFKALPDEVINIFGGKELNVDNFNYYFAMIYKIVLVVICGYCFILGCSILHDEETKGTIEYLYAQHISRKEILLAKMIVSILIGFILVLCALLSSIVCGLCINENTLKVDLIIKSGMIPSLSIILFICLGFFIASILKKNVKSTSLCIGIYFGLFILGYISTLGVKSLTFFKWFSPNEFLSPLEVVANKNLSLGIVITLLVSIISSVSAILLYNKKDF